MRIDERDALNISKPQPDRLFQAMKTDGSSVSQKARTADAGSDGIDLGSQAGLLAQAHSAGAGERAGNVERLRALYQSGQYQVDPTALSQAIVTATLSGY